MSSKVYQIVTDRILEELDKGIIPWKKTWHCDGSLPMNLISKKEYRGTNLVLLPTCYNSPFFLTFKQAKKLGGSVRKGEKSHLVIFWKFFDKIDNDGEKVGSVPMLRYYNVFNVEQCENINPAKIPAMAFDDQPEIEPIEFAEQIIQDMPLRPEIKHNEARAYYSPSLDYVNMPKRNLWDGKSDNYYSTLFHELVHSTGHEKRCKRGIEENAGFGSVSYSKEELIAEMGSAFLCSITGILNDDILKNSASYIDGWKRRIREDNKLVVTASGKAQKAVDFILNKKFDDTNKETKTEYKTESNMKPVVVPVAKEAQLSLFV